MLAYWSNCLRMIARSQSNMLHKLIICLSFYSSWKRSLENGRNSLDDGVPWITFEARLFLESVLDNRFTVFEYGAGGSTLFFSERVNRVISVEHDPNWFYRVKDALAKREINNCDLLFIPPEYTAQFNVNIDDPEAYCSSSESYRGYNFYRYASYIDLFPNEFFDFIAIDGRARPSCILHARSKVKIGGYLMLDNSERPHYQRAKGLLSDWEKHAFYGPGPYCFNFWETTIWRRIK